MFWTAFTKLSANTLPSAQYLVMLYPPDKDTKVPVAAMWGSEPTARIVCGDFIEAGSTATCVFLSSSPTQLALLGPLEASRLAPKLVVLYLGVRVHDLIYLHFARQDLHLGVNLAVAFLGMLCVRLL
jgi:hypothetical protein